MALNYHPTIEQDQQRALRFAEAGKYNVATDQLRLAFGKCFNPLYYPRTPEGVFASDVHRLRITRDIGATAARRGATEGLMGNGGYFQQAKEHLYDSLGALLDMTSETDDPTVQRHLYDEAGASASWLIRRSIALAVLDTKRQAEHLSEARELGGQAIGLLAEASNKYYSTSLYVSLARLAKLGGNNKERRRNMRRARKHVAGALLHDRRNLMAAAKTYGHTALVLRFGNVRKDIAKGRL